MKGYNGLRRRSVNGLNKDLTFKKIRSIKLV